MKKNHIKVLLVFTILSIVFGGYLHVFNLESHIKTPNLSQTPPPSFFSTYFGGSSQDVATDIEVGVDGSYYVVGYTESTDYPTSNALLSSHQGSTYDAFITKFNPDFSISYSTYLGGFGNDRIFAVAVNEHGHCFVTGSTSSTNDFPTYTLWGDPYDDTYNGGSTDTFVTKLQPDGTIAFSTFLGGSNTDIGYNIAIDAEGSIYVVGTTLSSNFPMMGAFDSTLSSSEVFVSKFSWSGDLEYSTYIGGDSADAAYDIAVSSSEECYIAGETSSNNFNTQDPAFPTRSGGSDIFLTKLNPNFTLNYSTYFGGSENDYKPDLAVNEDGECFLVGHTTSADFPMKNAQDDVFGGVSNLIISKFNSTGSLDFCTYFGNLREEQGDCILTDQDTLIVTGKTSGNNLPTMNAYYPNRTSGWDAFISEFDLSGNLLFSSYWGGTDDDSSYGVTSNSNGDYLIVGETESTDFPLSNSIDDSRDGTSDIYIAKILDPQDDPDSDGLINVHEHSYGTDPGVADSDGDDLLDGEEVDLGTDPLHKDTDRDGIKDSRDSNPLSFFFPTGLILVIVGSSIAVTTVILIVIKPGKQLKKNKVRNDFKKIQQKILEGKYQEALDDLEETLPYVDKVHDDNMFDQWHSFRKQCDVCISYIDALDKQRENIALGNYLDAYSKLMSLLKEVNSGDYAEYVDKKIVSDITDLLKKASDQNSI